MFMSSTMRNFFTARILLLVVLPCTAASPAAAQNDRSAQKKDTNASSEIHQLFVADQDERRSWGSKTFTDEEIKQAEERDAKRRERAKQIYLSGGLKTGRDYYDAALLFQHGDQPDDYLLAHVLATVGIAKGNTDCRWMAAATLDRFLQSLKQKQVFGTQFIGQDNRYTYEPYDATLLTDDVRKAMDVPVLAQQQKDLDDMNKNAPPEKPASSEK